MESKRGKKIYIVGHKNPDTDSICSAIAYANLKRKMSSGEYIAKRAGLLNEETQYVLNRFGVEPPKLLSNVHLQVKDVDVNRTPGIKGNTSIKEAWAMMKERKAYTIAVTKNQKLVLLQRETLRLHIWMSMTVIFLQLQRRNIRIL